MRFADILYAVLTDVRFRRQSLTGAWPPCEDAIWHVEVTASLGLSPPFANSGVPTSRYSHHLMSDSLHGAPAADLYGILHSGLAPRLVSDWTWWLGTALVQHEVLDAPVLAAADLAHARTQCSVTALLMESAPWWDSQGARQLVEWYFPLSLLEWGVRQLATRWGIK